MWNDESHVYRILQQKPSFWILGFDCIVSYDACCTKKKDLEFNKK